MEIHPFPEKVQGNFLQIFRPFLFEFIKDTGNPANSLKNLNFLRIHTRSPRANHSIAQRIAKFITK